MKENFLGKWYLIPENSEYSQGTPPKEATYEFKNGKDDSLDVFLKWKDMAGKEFEISYNTVPDGKRKKYENPEIADEVMSEFEAPTILNSYTYKGGKTLAFSSRIIDDRGIMKVIQRFFTPDGKHFDNVQYYKPNHILTSL